MFSQKLLPSVAVNTNIQQQQQQQQIHGVVWKCYKMDASV
jgi:hypothetical protein